MEDTFYNKVRTMVGRACHPHFIQPTDQEDITQDIFMSILEEANKPQPKPLTEIIKKHVGKFRQQKSRDRDRLISIPQGAT